jgi:hypothetical protein
MLTLKRHLYRLLLRLHPAPYRRRFAREMTLDFEDALATFGFARLFLDATRSLARQWTTTPSFVTPNGADAPIPLHPLLAGQYLAIGDDKLKPLELFRGSLLFTVLFFFIGLALNTPGNRVPHGHLPGLPANQADALRRAQDGPFQPRATKSSPGTLVRSTNSAHPDPSARYILGAGNRTGEWGADFFLRCAVISAIVWLVSFLVRRSRSVGGRIGFVAVGGIAIVAAAAYIPAPASPAYALKERFALIHSPQAMRTQPVRTPSFETVTIRPSNPAPGDPPTPVSALAGTPGIESGDSIRITLPIRSLLTSVCDTPSQSQPCIIGGPAWLDSDTYDIQAKIDGTDLAAMRQMSPAQQQYQIELMEQSLLVTRFHLKAHVETRALAASRPAPAQSPVEVLVIDHIDRPSEN